MQIAENTIPRYSHIAICKVDLKCDYGADESEVAERMSERADTAYSPRFREEEHSAATEQIAVYFSDAHPLRLRCGRNCALQNSRCYPTSVTLQREAGCAPGKKKQAQVLYSKATTEQQRQMRLRCGRNRAEFRLII